MLEKNLAANYLGQAWIAIINLLFIPIFFSKLGSEGFGLIGFYTTLATVLGLVDLGLTPAVSREMSRAGGGRETSQHIREVFYSVELLISLLSLLVIGSVYCIATYLSNDWLNTETLEIDSVANSIKLIGLLIGLRLLESYYRSVMIGLQRQVTQNLLSVISVTVRNSGSLLVLVVFGPRIEVFFVWQVIVSFVSVSSFRFFANKAVPVSLEAMRFRLAAIAPLKKFSVGTFGLTVIALVVTQLDKLMLSKVLSLGDYGLYITAASVASILYMAIAPVTQAFYPTLCSFHAERDGAAFRSSFKLGSQIITVTCGSLAITLVFFAPEILFAWTGSEEVSSGSTVLVLQLLGLGNLFSVLNTMPFQAQLALGETKKVFRLNLLGLIIIVPLVVYASINYGALGAAVCWLLYTFVYFVVCDRLLFDDYLVGMAGDWYAKDIAIPLFFGFLWVGSLSLANPKDSSRFEGLVLSAMALVGALLVSSLASNAVRKFLIKSF